MKLDTYDHFHELNPNTPNKELFHYILVGQYEVMPEWLPAQRSILACSLNNNLEHYKTLLSFTAWYALTKNNLLTTDYAGIFEYDCEITQDLFSINLAQNSIIGFLHRALPDIMYLDCVPKFEALLMEDTIRASAVKTFWCPTTNFIVHEMFLSNFVNWFLTFIPQILQVKNHPHFHERAINVFAFEKGVEVVYKEGYLVHEQLCSHGIDCNVE